MKNFLVASALVALAAHAPMEAKAQIDWSGISSETTNLRHQLRINNSKVRGQKGRSTKKRQSRRSQKTRSERVAQVRVDGRTLRTSAPAIEFGGRSFVPFRDIFEALGATVDYNARDRLITAWRGDSRMQLSLPGGSREAMSTRESFARRDEPFMRGGVTMVPLRMVSEKMGARVTHTPRRIGSLISITTAP